MHTLRSTSRRRLIALVVAATALTALMPAVAGAARSPRQVDQAWFKATLSGSQATTWEHRHVRDENDPCDASSYGNGSQHIRFKVPRTFWILFTKPSKAEPNLFFTKGRPAISTRPILLYANATAEREGDYTVNYGEIDDSRCDGVGSGGGSTQPPAKDCGTRTGKFRVNLFFHTDTGEEELFIPLPRGGYATDKDRLKLAGEDYSWNGPQGPSGGLDEQYATCPFLLRDHAVQEQQGRIFTSQEKLSEKQLFNPRKRRFTVSGDVIAKRGDGEVSGQTILAWNLKLTRTNKRPRY